MNPTTKEEAQALADNHWQSFIELSRKNADMSKQIYHRTRYKKYSDLANTLPSESKDLSWKPARKASSGQIVTGLELPLHEEFLTESRLDFLKDTIKDISTDHDGLAHHRDSKSIIDHFAEHGDPTKKKVYTQWILNRYKEGNFRQEDTDRIHTALSHFDSHKAKLEKKDIGQYKTLNDLEDAVEPHIGTHVSKNAEDKAIKEEGATKLHDSDTLSVHQIHTHDAACRYGAGTKWCTAAADNPSMFNRYHNEGHLFVFRDKKADKKFQFHAETNQFMNEKDEPQSLHDFVQKHPEIKDVKELSGKHPVFEKDYSALLSNSKADQKYAKKAYPILKPDDASDVYLSHNEEYPFHVLKNNQLTSNHIEKIYDVATSRKKDSAAICKDSFYNHPNSMIEFLI